MDAAVFSNGLPHFLGIEHNLAPKPIKRDWALRPHFDYKKGVSGAMFNGDESRILTWSEDGTAAMGHSTRREDTS